MKRVYVVMAHWNEPPEGLYLNESEAKDSLLTYSSAYICEVELHGRKSKVDFFFDTWRD